MARDGIADAGIVVLTMHVVPLSTLGRSPFHVALKDRFFILLGEDSICLVHKAHRPQLAGESMRERAGKAVTLDEHPKH
jgi:hypothetical protein